mgnify:CR=1 FL=1
MSDILSRLEQQGQDFSNIAQRGQEMVQGFDNDRLIAQGQTLAYNMGKAQLSTLIGAETVAGLQHGVPVVYKTGKAIAQRLQGMPTTKEEAVARASKVAQQAGEQVVQRVKSTAQPLVENITQETSSGAPGDFLQYDPQRGTMINKATGEDITDDRYDTELQTPSGARADPALQQARLERLETPADPPRSAFQTVPERQEFPELGSRSFQAPTESAFRAETESQRIAAQASSGPPPPPQPAEPIPAVAESEPSIGLRPVEGEFSGRIGSYVRPGTQLRVEPDVRAPQLQPEIKAPSTGGRFADTGEPAPPPPPRDAPGGPEAPSIGSRSIEDLFPAPPTSLPTPAVPVDAEGRELQPQAQTQTSALSQQDDQEANLQERLQNLRVQDGDGSGGGSQPNQQPEFKEDEDEPSTASKVGEDIGKAEADVAPEEEIADAVPGLGEILGGVIGLGALIGGAIEGSETPKAPQQPAGMPAFQTAYDSAPVIDSDNYHSI